MYTMEYYSARKKKNENLPFVTPWMDLEGIIPNKISQSGKPIPYDFIDFTHM